MNPAASLSRKYVSAAMSSGVPVRRAGVLSTMRCRISSLMSLVMSVSIRPGATQLTRIAGPNAVAQLRANAMMAAFDVPYAISRSARIVDGARPLIEEMQTIRPCPAG